MPLWLTQLGTLGHAGEALRDELGRRPSNPAFDYKGNRNVMQKNGSVFFCPSDLSTGDEGGRPDGLEADKKQIDQYYFADVDPHGGLFLSPSLNPTSKLQEDRIPCSFLYEINWEPCDWLYAGGSLGSPSGREFRGVTPGWDVVGTCDSNGDGIVSWYEIKKVTKDGKQGIGLTAWGERVPILSCYHHVPKPYLKPDSRIIYGTGLSNVYMGSTCWELDEAAH
jgi:hypothetical protein